MNQKSEHYIKRLQKTYEHYGDNEGLLALADINKEQNRIMELEQYRDLDKTQELIKSAIARYSTCIAKLTSPEENKKMSDIDRAHCFATMDWARFTLDIIGESTEKLDDLVDKMIADRVEAVGNKLR